MMISGAFSVEKTIECERCGTHALSRHSVQAHRWSVEQLDKHVMSLLPNIPVGWCMNGRDHLICKGCMK